MFDLLKKLFLNKCKFFTCDNDKFKGVYLCEYLDDWERFNETLSLKKKIFIVT